MQGVFKNKLLQFLIGVFLIVSAFAPLSMAGMDHHKNHTGCPFMVGEMSVCSMNIFEHIAAWQALMHILPVEFAYAALLLLSFVLSLIWLRYLYSPPDIHQHRLCSVRQMGGRHFFVLFLLGRIINPRAP